MLAVLSFKIARHKCLSPIWDQDKVEFKVGDMVLLKNNAPTNAFYSKYKPSFRICKQISDKAFDVHNSTGKVRHMSIHLQLLHHTEHVLTNLPDITSIKWTMKYFNHSNLMSNLHTPVKTQNKLIKGKYYEQ